MRAGDAGRALRALAGQAASHPRCWLALAAVAIGGCGAGSAGSNSRNAPPARPPLQTHYSSAFRASWLRTCESSAAGARTAQARCDCTVTYLEAHASQTTLESTERAVLKGEAKEPDWLLNAIVACQAG
jgi:hypothetical protein